MADTVLRAERDALVLLGLLTRAHLEFDQPIVVSTESDPTHFRGLNIFGCIIDNSDGELLGLGCNRIHADLNPVEHGEQRALRAAIARAREKRPRGPETTVEQYYREKMFMAPGRAPSDYIRLGASCYTTLEPCPMCASTLLVARLKRVVFVLRDAKYGGAWPDLKKRYYVKDPSTYGPLVIQGMVSPLTERVAALLDELRVATDALRESKVRDTHLLDHCAPLLGEASKMLMATSNSDLVTSGADRKCNSTTLRMFKAACNFPAA